MRKHIPFLFLFMGLFTNMGNRAVYAQETWTFNVVVAVEKHTSDYFQQAYGKDIRQLVKDQIATVNANFNSGQGFNGKFNFQADSIYIYEGDPGKEIFSPHPGYMYRVVVSGFYDNKIGGGWYGDFKTIYHSWAWYNGGGPFGKGATDGLTHEFGHARGAIDIYGARVEGKNNPINLQTFEPVSSVMNFPYDNLVWDAYTVNLLNSTGGKSVEGEDYITKSFPKSIQVRAVDTKGKALGDAVIEAYPVNWFSYSVSPSRVDQTQTNLQGIGQFFSNPFQPSTLGYPWHIKYPNLLIKATYNATVAYKWMPVYEVQNEYFKNGANSVYTTEILFPETTPALKINHVSAHTLCPGKTIEVAFTPLVSLDADERFSLVLINSYGSQYPIKINQSTTSLSGPIPYLVIEPNVSYWLKVISTKTNAQTEAYAITLRPFPEPPTSQYLGLCQNATAPTLSVTGQNLMWYSISSPNSSSATAPTINTSQLGETTYYVTQTVDGCESPKAMIKISVSPTPNAPGVTSKDFCQSSPPETLTATGTGLTWYNADGTKMNTVPVVSTDKAGTFNYQVTQTVKGCEGPKATAVVNVRARAIATLTGSQTVVEGQPASITVVLTGEGPWTFSYRDSTATGAVTVQTIQAATSPYTIATNPTKTTAYYLTAVSNVCGTGILTSGKVVVTVNPLLGLEDPLPANLIDVFPVPTTTTLTVRINGLSPTNPAALELTNLAGQTQIRHETSAESTTLPLDGVPAGTYILQIRVGNRSISKRIIKL